MDQLRIEGGHELNGIIEISGAKNAALPLMAACLLTDKPLTLTNIPHLKDILSLAEVLENLGVEISFSDSAEQSVSEQEITLNAHHISSTTADYELVRKMRASILVLGPLVARHKSAKVSLPGGCAIGTRPVDLHIDGLQKMGAEIQLEEGYIQADAPNGLTGAHITFPKVSVGATENIMMAAALAKGITILENAAQEPEIANLGECLNAMGAKISGFGTSTLKIEGVEELHGATHEVVADRIEAGTYIIASIMTPGALQIKNAPLDLLTSLSSTLNKAGIDLIEENGITSVICHNKRPMSIDIMTEPHPGFPTDLQAQMMAMLSLSEGAGMVTETIFENRFMHVPELIRMGADITVHTASALVRGKNELRGAQVMATDLRASSCLVLAALAAKGETTISRIYHLDRGYEKLEEKLGACGAKLERI